MDGSYIIGVFDCCREKMSSIAAMRGGGGGDTHDEMAESELCLS